MTIADNPFAIVVESEGGGPTVVHLSGELDVATGAELRACLAPLLAAGADIVVDLAGLSFMDSTGISVLIGAHKRAAAEPCSFAIRGAQGAVAKVLEISGVDQVFTIVDSH